VRVYSRRIVRCQSKLGISKFLVVARETIAQVTAEAIAGGYISPGSAQFLAPAPATPGPTAAPATVPAIAARHTARRDESRSFTRGVTRDTITKDDSHVVASCQSVCASGIARPARSGRAGRSR
jgi:hypothetical protein